MDGMEGMDERIDGWVHEREERTRDKMSLFLEEKERRKRKKRERKVRGKSQFGRLSK